MGKGKGQSVGNGPEVARGHVHMAKMRKKNAVGMLQASGIMNF